MHYTQQRLVSFLVLLFLLLPSQGLQQGEDSIPMFQGSNLFAEMLEVLSIPHAGCFYSVARIHDMFME